MATIQIDDFAKVELVVARVTEAFAHPNADKLIVLKIDAGDGDADRQIVAGIRQWYPPESLVGKNIVIVNNLQPATLRGIESRGMLLAAQDPATGEVVVLTADKPVTPGSKIR
ncbi:MAG TPA: methionine--tRNA ligase subunit beta [Candidatus Brocadiia bacterium]|nr:methionine--tRNA ligase subunit beta [Candidatus Brocadiia bacterium]